MFESLQIRGIYKFLKHITDKELKITAMSNGVKSRPVIFKKKTKVAQVLNLVVGMDRGKIDFLEWRNSCYDDQGCEPEDCLDTSVTVAGQVHSEQNCFTQDCGTEGDYSCDTQVFVTWVGRDNGRDDCTSDNYRISAFLNYGIMSYLESVRDLVNF